MPKRILLIALAVTALALAACNIGYNPNYLYGTPLPTATMSTSTPNPTISAAIVTVYASSVPLPNWQVNLYTSTSAGNAGTLLKTQTTDSTGTTTFSNLTPGTTYCFNSQYSPPSGLMQNTYICNFTWFNGVVFNFP
jgi:energy-converting hydrogenase Eha subunit F